MGECVAKLGGDREPSTGYQTATNGNRYLAANSQPNRHTFATSDLNLNVHAHPHAAAVHCHPNRDSYPVACAAWLHAQR